MQSLQEEIDERAQEIHTDRYSMSISEAVAMYSEGDLEIHPEFQRIFRWTIEQQSRLIESIFLGVPIPPIFVAQRQDGVWDVVDGVQRLSSILRFMGVLRDEDKKKVGAIPLVASDYLKHLKGIVWDSEVEIANGFKSNNTQSLTDAQRRVFKRARIDFNIVQKESDERAKFDLFQRLNSGTRLSEQEARNCLAVMLDPKFARWLNELSKLPEYDAVMDISETKEQESYGVESILRYLAFANAPHSELKKMGDVGEYLTRKMRAFVEDPHFNRDEEEERFKFVFTTLFSLLGKNAFKRPTNSGNTSGRFSISAFEAISSGLARNYTRWREMTIEERSETLPQAIDRLWNDDSFNERAGGGKRANQRIPYMVEAGERAFGS
ncbi:DUF262 domain-containing protein [Saccharopolyspora sp. K220]|uniref:DUF262 domain-containing protein n=1 Tax=Saccharopolyspora soli TaxID=2926618 RepID=UPI001F581A15|nr:DUF262 domain-containing protein [Saccharopolyspora soli]MCI2421827.1 DUF262 domain-containing protein [Saccharopolyspora soli]